MEQKSEQVYGIKEENSEIGEPVPRFSHQFLYNSKLDSYFVFGGNPHNIPVPGEYTDRLNDFWILSLIKPNKQDVFEKAKYLIKKEQYLE